MILQPIGSVRFVSELTCGLPRSFSLGISVFPPHFIYGSLIVYYTSSPIVDANGPEAFIPVTSYKWHRDQGKGVIGKLHEKGEEREQTWNAPLPRALCINYRLLACSSWLLGAHSKLLMHVAP